VGEAAVVDGRQSVEDLVRWGFAHALVVMANEAHSGLTRCVRTRETGVRQGNDRGMGPDGLALPRHVGYRPVRHRS